VTYRTQKITFHTSKTYRITHRTQNVDYCRHNNIRFTAIFHDNQASWYQVSPFRILLELKMMSVVVTPGAIRCAKLKSNRRHQQTDTQLLIGRMPFLWANQTVLKN